ncbi:hypothetical protein J5N97_017078 [Dioscorea zingiberensis]|uniref:F-box domain-containing protein n=1 Tax=Dioscorea zingiberensis TaxID=325984 RepID=A0A9D5CMK3_9LILI|nr:hypothetical protein J5N97_017078 [Dioscorea zingiberensis]
MGSFLSAPVSKTELLEDSETSQAETCKRLRMMVSCDEDPRLIPSLPDEISLQILARVPRICYLSMKLVSRNWKAAISSNEVYLLRKELGTKGRKKKKMNKKKADGFLEKMKADGWKCWKPNASLNGSNHQSTCDWPKCSYAGFQQIWFAAAMRSPSGRYLVEACGTHRRNWLDIMKLSLNNVVRIP